MAAIILKVNIRMVDHHMGIINILIMVPVPMVLDNMEECMDLAAYMEVWVVNTVVNTVTIKVIKFNIIHEIDIMLC
jgi:hypothetical protein